MKPKCKSINKKTFLSILVLSLGMIISIPAINVDNRNHQKYNVQQIDEKFEHLSDAITLKSRSTINLNTANIRDIAYLLMDSNEHYHYSDLFIKEYQQDRGGYIAFAKKTGHLVDKSNCEPDQKWHFFQSWIYQSFKEGSLTWESDAKSRVYTSLQCAELLLWIYEACGVDSSKVANAYEVAVQGKIVGTVTATIAKNMRSVVAWEDLVAGLSAKLADYSLPQVSGEPQSGITVGDVANFLIDKNEHYTQTKDFIKNHQPLSGGYIDFAGDTGHTINKNNGEPNSKWNFFEYWLLDSMKNGHFDWNDDAKINIYDNLESLELLLWIFEACDISSAKITSAKTVAENGRNTLEDPAVTAGKMREYVSWSELAAIIRDQKAAISVTLSPNPLELAVGDDVKLTAIVEPSNTTDIPAWSIIDGEENINITPNGNSATVHGINVGTAEIEISYSENVSDICLVTVTEPEIAIKDLPSEIFLDIAETLTLNPTLNIGNGTFTFGSSDDGIASVTSAGVVTGVAYGSATITVECVENPELVSNIAVTVRELVEGVETLYSTCLFGSGYNSRNVNNYTSEFSSTNNGFTWDLQYFSNNNSNWDFVRVGTNTASVGTITTNSAYSVPISKVVLVIDAIRSQFVNSISLSYGPSLGNLANSIEIDSYSAGEHTFTIPNPIINQYYRLSFDCAVWSSGDRPAQVSKIEFYKQDISTTSDLDDLLALMNEADTCADFADAEYLRELYNALSPEDQEIFDNTICAENPGCTMAEKLAYMEYLNEVARTDTAGLGTLRDMVNSPTSLITIILTALIGVFAVFGYYFYNKKKYIKS